MVDASEMQIERTRDSIFRFSALVQNPELTGIPILVLANKSDLPSACEPSELIQQYGVERMQSHRIAVYPCSVLTGSGLQEGLDWLAS